MDPQAGQGALPPAHITWTKPEPWKETPARGMRKANYLVTGEAGSAELTVFYFGLSSGGSAEENIARWIGQFLKLAPDAVRREQMDVDGNRVFLVNIESGTFASKMPGGPQRAQENWGMRAAVVETPSGPYFFKLTGPSATVSAEKDRFTELLRSIQIKK